jgi:purine nucleosidase
VQNPLTDEGRAMHRIIIDSDTAADDCFAILVAACHPDASLEAITIVAGNVTFEQQVENALLTLDAAGRTDEVPVHLGASRPMIRPWRGASAHGDGKGNHEWAKAKGSVSSRRAVQAILDTVDAHPGEVDFICIGPLTNLAAALMEDRDLPSKLRSLTIMGGCDNAIGNVTAAAEYNFWVDPEAARAVLEAGFDPTILTWTVTREQGVWSRERLAEVRAMGTGLSEFFSIVNAPNVDWNESVGIQGSTHPDSITAMLVVRPDLAVKRSRAYVNVETQGEMTRGYSLIDRRIDRHEPNAWVVDEIDADGFYEAMRGILATR